MKRLITVLFLIILSDSSKSQIKRIHYCECNTASPIKDVVKYTDSVFSIINTDSLNYYVNIFNTTKDTIFLFSTYLQQQFFDSKYLHRVNKKEKMYKVSFVPLIPFLSTNYSDNIATSNVIVREDQVVYDFIKMQPNSFYSFKVAIKNSFRSGEVVKDFNPKTLNLWNSKTKFTSQHIGNSDLNKYKWIFELAIYKDILLLCTKSAYFLQQTEFNQEAKNFTIIPIVIKM